MVEGEDLEGLPFDARRAPKQAPANFRKKFQKAIDKYPLPAYNREAALKQEAYAPLAQLVEQLTLNQWVHGSSP